MITINTLYSTSTPSLARKHILSLVPIHQRNQFLGLLMVYQNSIIHALTLQASETEAKD